MGSLCIGALLPQAGTGCAPRLWPRALVSLQPFKPSSFKGLLAVVLMGFGEPWGKKLTFACFNLH